MVTGTRATTRPILILIIVGSLSFLIFQSTIRQHALSTLSAPLKQHLQALTLSLGGLPDSAPARGTQSCEVCVVDPDNPLCEYGLDNVRQSKAFEGSGYRMRKFLEKAIRGEEVRIGVIGASVTRGHGLKPGQSIWYSQFFDEFQRMFPNSKIYDGSSPGVNSKFYAWCFESLLPRDLDLYILELDINNEMKDATFNADDTLFRGLLSLPQEPAVMRVSVFALAFADLARGLTAGLMLSHFFDVPVISVRNFLLPHILANPKDAETFFSRDWKGDTDLRHIGHLGHSALGDMISLYMKEQVCEVKRRAISPPRKAEKPWPQPEVLGTVPSKYLWGPFADSNTATPVVPICAFIGSDKQPLHTVKESMKGSWRREEWNGKAALTTSDPGATAVFPFVGTSVGLFVWMTDGAGSVVKPGMAGCWVDDALGAAVLVNAYRDNGPAGSGWTLIQKGLDYGNHTLSCEVLEASSTSGHDFRILGVASQ